MFNAIGTIIIGILTAFFYGKFNGSANEKNKQNKKALQNIAKAKKIERDNSDLNDDELNNRLSEYTRNE